MAKRNRPSQLKREREQKKRDRQRTKADKANEKREKRFGTTDGESDTLQEPHTGNADTGVEENDGVGSP